MIDIQGSINLRRLTLKSILGFGDNKDLCIGEMINAKKYKELISIYYLLSKIDFNDEIKDILCLDASRTIQKPGTNKELYLKNVYQIVCDINEKFNLYDYKKSIGINKKANSTKKSNLLYGEISMERKAMNRRKNRMHPTNRI